jgi:hypothetical protein
VKAGGKQRLRPIFGGFALGTSCNLKLNPELHLVPRQNVGKLYFYFITHICGMAHNDKEYLSFSDLMKGWAEWE